jgi:hypothetical protein
MLANDTTLKKRKKFKRKSFIGIGGFLCLLCDNGRDLTPIGEHRKDIHGYKKVYLPNTFGKFLPLFYDFLP